MGEPVDIDEQQPDDEEDGGYAARHPQSLQNVVSDAFSDTAPSILPSGSQSPEETSQRLPLFSESGFVHLGPRSISPNSSRSGRGTSPTTSRNQSGGPTQNDTPADGSTSSSISSSESTELLTVRFEHKETEDGHHVLTGREGAVTRCEDEPIRSPGAVQSFGVLIALEQTDDCLIVRQVSENSTQVLGLSPKYLFNLECFSDILPDSQANILWENVQFLSEATSDTSEDGPTVFLLSGYGEPDNDETSSISSSSTLNDDDQNRRPFTAWCAVHRPAASPYITTEAAPPAWHANMVILEFELEKDSINPLYPPPGSNATHASSSGSSSSSGGASSGNSSRSGSTLSASSSPHTALSPNSTNELAPRGDWQPAVPSSLQGLSGTQEWIPSPEDILESTTSMSKPLQALERLRRLASGPGAGSNPGSGTGRRGRRRMGSESIAGRAAAAGGVGMLDVFNVQEQINEQLGAATDLDGFLKIVVGIVKDLTQFHRVLVYQFDDKWNGQTVAELVDWSQTHDLYKGLHFPASDIPAQARQLYTINKVRLLYDRSQPTARLVVRSKEDLKFPLNMTHCYLRAMSPIHIKYLANMGVRASMSISIIAFGALWGLVACHSYGMHGMRVSFPVRQMLRVLSQSISKNIERLSYAQRLRTRKLINTVATENHPTGYIVSNADDLLGLFDADFGILVVGEGAKILGPNLHGQEVLIIAEYLRMKQFATIQVSQAVTQDFPDLDLPNLEVIAGLLYVPLSYGGRDFIAFLRKGQPRDVHWAGKPNKDVDAAGRTLEPRKSFKIWSETVAGKCRTWTDEQFETAGVLALVYGKFIEVWRQKESALQTTKLTNLLLSNASHEVRTPLNHIINYLEMALNGPLDGETRDNLRRSHAASKGLLFTINDLLDLTRLESGNETSFNEPFDLPATIEDACQIYAVEAHRRNLEFSLNLADSPKIVVGDSKKIRTAVQNLTANALKYTDAGSVTVSLQVFVEPDGLRSSKQTAVEISVTDTGRGISPEKLETIFREFEQVETSETKASDGGTVGLGLAVVSRIVEQLGGQLRVDSEVGTGSSFSFLIPLALPDTDSDSELALTSSASTSSSLQLRKPSIGSLRSKKSEVDSIVEALGTDHMTHARLSPPAATPSPKPAPGTFEIPESSNPVRPVKIECVETHFQPAGQKSSPPPAKSLRVLVVEDNDINLTLLAKRLTMSGHSVVKTTNGQEGYEAVERDREFDCVLMDIQMPILDGFQCTEKIRELENLRPQELTRPSQQNNGRIPIFAVSASLLEARRADLAGKGFDGWILKPIDFKRLDVILKGVLDDHQRQLDLYRPGCDWELGGWFGNPGSLETPASSV
ncbi:hypothetical protein DL96DRAFT_1467371 [Flagelloscypha sp. PMI_526]|nr:hypothetical protein DL96DRAFT_1467371 [Flagelloscypha sp. PMI_526]